jgi:hypothetical protein
MTPEWEEFAAEIDRACARNFNAMQVDLEQVWEQSDSEGWDDAATASASWHVQSIHQADTHREVTALGEPPAKAELFNRWAATIDYRARLMEEVSQAWSEGDERAANVARLRVEGSKVDANWLGQHFGLRICTSNGPGREPGDSAETYLSRVNRVCLDRNREEDELGAARLLTPVEILRLSKGETLGIAAVGPTPEQYPIRHRILQIKRSLDRFAEEQLRQAARRPNWGRIWEQKLKLPVERHANRASLQLQGIGLPDCSNYGPTPAPSLLPG